MKVLHTSDWHIGRTLYGRKRYEEFETFLTWLAETIQQNTIDALLVAGDVFDTSTPEPSCPGALLPIPVPGSGIILSTCRGCRWQSRFPLVSQRPQRTAQSVRCPCGRQCTEDPEDEVLVLRDENGYAGADRLCRPIPSGPRYSRGEAGESIEDKERKANRRHPRSLRRSRGPGRTEAQGTSDRTSRSSAWGTFLLLADKPSMVMACESFTSVRWPM